MSTQPQPSDPSSASPLKTTWIWGYVALVFILGLAWMVARPPGLFSDSVSGFLVMRSMERGAPFNHTFVVDPDDIAVDQSEFTAWWTPGQYVVPMVLGWSGLDLGQSAMAATGLAWLVGLVGFARLWRRLGFAPDVTAISVALLFSQTYVLGWARFYHGGEMLQWAFFPWFVLVALRFQLRRWYDVLVLSVALTLGAFLKSSFLMLGSSVIASLLWGSLRGRWGPLRTGSALVVGRALIVVAVSVAALWAYTSSGRSPAGKGMGGFPTIDLRESLFAAAGPLGSLFDLSGTYLTASEAVVWTETGVGFPLLMVSLASVCLLWAMARYSGSRPVYLHLVIGMYVCTVAAFMFAWSLDVLISFNVRHFRLVGVLLIPGIVAMALRVPSRAGRGAVVAALAFLSILMVFRSADPGSEAAPVGSVGESGFSHSYASQPAIDALRAVDSRLGDGNNLVGVPWPQMGIDVLRSRVFNMKTALQSEEEFEHKVFFGEVDNLVVVLPIHYEERGKTAMVLRAFREHGDWRRIHPEVEDFVFMHSGDRADLR